MFEVEDTSIAPRQLRAEYEAGASIPELADLHDLKQTSVYTALRRAGTRMRPAGGRR